MPFSWELLYYASVCVALASAIYAGCCPRIVKNYDQYSELAGEGQGWTFIAFEFASALGGMGSGERDSKAKRQSAAIDKFMKSMSIPLEDESAAEYEQPCLRLERISLDQTQLPVAFWYVRNLADRRNACMRTISAVCYFVSFGVLAIIAAQNLVSVWVAARA